MAGTNHPPRLFLMRSRPMRFAHYGLAPIKKILSDRYWIRAISDDTPSSGKPPIGTRNKDLADEAKAKLTN